HCAAVAQPLADTQPSPLFPFTTLFRSNKPWNKLPKQHRDAVLFGTGEKRYQVEWKAKSGGGGNLHVRWEGVMPLLLRRMSESKSDRKSTRLNHSHVKTSHAGVCLQHRT